MNLFQNGLFTLHSGVTTNFRIDCDALTEADIFTLALRLKKILPPYGRVEGVPRGGLQLAHYLRDWRQSEDDPILIVDDVYTTGGSMEAHRAGRQAIGAVLFARRPVTHGWITALFTMAEGADV